MTVEFALVAKLPISLDCAPFSRWLNEQGIRHQFVERAGLLEVYVESAHALIVQKALQEFVGNPEVRDFIAQQASAKPRAGLSQVFLKTIRFPVVFGLIMMCALVAVITTLGHGGPILRALVFADPFQVVDDTFSDRLQALVFLVTNLQLWRLVTPALIHFSLLHLIFNMLWFWYFGSRIESLKGGMYFFVLVILLAAGSNVFQYLLTGPLFGGMSGVVYGLLGYCWVVDLGRENKRYAIPDALMGFMTVWLLIGFTDLTVWLGMGHMANGAHLAGLLLGLAAGWRERNRLC